MSTPVAAQSAAGPDPTGSGLPPHPHPGESSLGGVSVRAWITLLLVGTVCLLSACQTIAAWRSGGDLAIDEPLYSLALIAAGYYYGQKTSQPPTK